MASVDAPWLATMRELAGVKEYPGGENNPTILGWASFIGNAWPEMAGYCRAYTGDDIAWCGLTMAYALAKNGIRPPFGSSDTARFLWANSFAAWGLRLDAPKVGAIVVFKWKGGRGHVGVVDHVDGKTIFVLAGNQSNAVNAAPFAWDDQVVGFFWPPAVAAQPAAARTPAEVRMRMGKAITNFEARRDAQGRLAVYALPANDGGGTYEVAGINDRYHPVEAAKLKAMIAAGQYQAAEDFVGEFTASYTDVADVWTSFWGVEFYLRDSVFNRGPTGAAKILQRGLLILGDRVGPDGVDGDVGPNTMAAVLRQEKNTDALLTALRQAREDYEREVVGYRANFWNGLTNRWNNALTVARQFQSEQAKEPDVADEPNATNEQVIKEMQAMGAKFEVLGTKFDQIATSLGAIASFIKSSSVPATPVVEPKPDPVPVVPVPVPVPTPAPSVLQQPGVGLGALGLLATGLLQAFGVVGPPAGETATTTGQVLPMLSAGIAALGATGMFGSWGTAISTVLSAFAQKPQPK